jgi:hypothetical protein
MLPYIVELRISINIFLCVKFCQNEKFNNHKQILQKEKKKKQEMQCYVLRFARFFGHDLIPLPFLVIVTSPSKHANPMS